MERQSILEQTLRGNGIVNYAIPSGLKRCEITHKVTSFPPVDNTQTVGFTSASDCDFVCPFDETHSLTEYHVINRIRSGVSDHVLQQELLQKSQILQIRKRF